MSGNDPAWTKPKARAEPAPESPEPEPQPEPEPEKPDRQAVPDSRQLVATRAVEIGTTIGEWGLFIALFFVAGGLAFLGTTIFVVKGSGSAPLQDQTGRSAWEASTWIVENGWLPQIDHFEASETYPPHTVIATDPSPGSQLRPGAVVRLTISRGARRIPMPNVAGVRLSQAQLILSRNGLVLGDVTEVFADNSEPDAVIATNPAPNAPLRVGDTVRFLVSKGPQPRTWVMPEVEGYQHEAVQRLFDRMGIQSRVAARMYDPGEISGAVLEQFPQAGEPVAEGEVVRLTVNERARTETSSSRSRLVPLDIQVPSGFAMREVVVRAVREDWSRTILHRYAAPGSRLRTVVYVAPGDRITVIIDDEPSWERRY